MWFNKRKTLITLLLGFIVGGMLLETGFAQFGGGRFGRFGGFGRRSSRFGNYRNYNNMNGRNRIQDVSTDLEELIDPDSTLKPYATVRGTVMDKDGKGVSGIEVTIDREDSKGSYKVKSKDRGKFLYDGLPAGQYVLGVIYKGEIGLLRPAELRNGRVVISDFDLGQFVGEGKANSLDDLKKGWEADAPPDDGTQKLARELRDLYEQAKDAQSKGDFATAISILKQLVAHEQGAKVPGFWARLGEIYLTTKKYDDSVASYKKALELSPDTPDYSGMIAIGLLLSDKIDEAIVYTEKTAALDPGKDGRKKLGAQAYYNLGLALTDKSDAKKAESAFETSIKLDEGYAEAHYQLGLTYLSTRPPSNPAAPNVDAVLPLKKFIGLSNVSAADLAKDPTLVELQETVAIAKALIAEVCKPPAAAKMDNCRK
jgi:tetratricopeptide (TPR) repeat protein